MYYQVFADRSDVRSKVAFDEELPSLGRIRCDSIAPPHTPASIKRRISRVEETPELVDANLLETISSDSPLKEAHISILGTDDQGLSEPMAIVQTPIVQLSIADGRYIIKNRAADIIWYAIGSSTSLDGFGFYSCLHTPDRTQRTDLQVRSILQLFKCSKDDSLFRSGT